MGIFQMYIFIYDSDRSRWFYFFLWNYGSVYQVSCLAVMFKSVMFSSCVWVRIFTLFSNNRSSYCFQIWYRYISDIYLSIKYNRESRILFFYLELWVSILVIILCCYVSISCLTLVLKVWSSLYFSKTVHHISFKLTMGIFQMYVYVNESVWCHRFYFFSFELWVNLLVFMFCCYVQVYVDTLFQHFKKYFNDLLSYVSMW